MRLHIQSVRLFAVVVGVLVAAIFSGCAYKNAKQSGFFRKNDQFYRTYLDGDVSQARQSLQQIIRHYKNSNPKIIGAVDQAHDLFCAYARLYVLEEKVGDKDAAEVALTRAQYWHLQEYDSNEDWQSRVPLRKFLSYQSSTFFAEVIQKLDKASNHGSEPNYIQYLSHPHTLPSKSQSNNDSTQWVESCLKDFEFVKVGMTRSQVESKLSKDGGLHTASQVHFVHPACRYFKIDVEFEFKRDAADQNRAIKGKDDRVTKVSKPYIERPFSD